MLTNNQSADVGTGGTFQVPSLVDLAHRAPYMHDGCAPAGCSSDHCTEWFEGWPRTAAPPVRGCPDWRAACGDVCPDDNRDRMNCGACGRACDRDQSCVSGGCVGFPGGSLCPGAGCVGLGFDPAQLRRVRALLCRWPGLRRGRLPVTRGGGRRGGPRA